MDDWEDELLGSPSAANRTALRRCNFWVVKNLLDRLILRLTGTQNDPMAPFSTPHAAPMDTEQLPLPL